MCSRGVEGVTVVDRVTRLDVEGKPLVLIPEVGVVGRVDLILVKVEVSLYMVGTDNKVVAIGQTEVSPLLDGGAVFSVSVVTWFEVVVT